MALLISSNDTVVKQKVKLEKDPIVLGRHPECDVQIDDGSVSRHHAQITHEHGEYFLQDLNSRNGTFLNSAQIHEPSKLFDGSEIRICDVAFRFHLSNHVPASAHGPTVESEAPSGTLHSSVIFDDDGENGVSTIMSQLDVPSHYHKGGGKVSADDKLQALIQITRALSDNVTRDGILKSILDCLFELFVEADRGFIVLKTPEGGLKPVSMKTRRPGDDEQVRISRTIANQVLSSKRPIITSDAGADSRFDMSQSIADFRIRSMMCAPLINSKDESIGIVQLDTLKNTVAFSEEDLEVLVTVGMQASLAIQKADMFEAAKEAEHIQSDLKLAHELQKRFLPQRSPNINDYEFFAYYKPMQQVGGDYYDYVELGDNKLAIMVADVVGHGIAAAMLMAKVSAESRFALAKTNDAVEAVTAMNNKLSGMNLDRFVTLVLTVFDLETNEVSIVNAGHMPPILRHASNGESEMVCVNESGLPLGVMSDFDYEQIKIQLDAGDVMVMYTDGVNESMNMDGQQLTTAGMLREITESQTKTADTIGNFLCDTVTRHVGTAPFVDDMCVVCVGRNG
ncbi:MAG: SpoIIE family protein phosphatase [Planctomycetota bacterium]